MLGGKLDILLGISHLLIFRSLQAHLRLPQEPTLEELMCVASDLLSHRHGDCPGKLEGLGKCFLWAKFFTTLLFYYRKQTKTKTKKSILVK